MPQTALTVTGGVAGTGMVFPEPQLIQASVFRRHGDVTQPFGRHYRSAHRTKDRHAPILAHSGNERENPRAVWQRPFP
jgi:hypothetical protein